MDIATAIQQLTDQLKSETDSPVQDAQVLLAHLLDLNRATIIAHPEKQLSNAQIERVNHAAEQLKNGVPLPHIIGKWSFYVRDFIVTPDVLIPRPETEHLIEYALEWLRANPSQRTAVDIGTGSGIIPITLACEIPGLVIDAIDISEDALAVAQRNVVLHQVQNQVKLKGNDLLAGIETQYDLICANLPYIPSARLPHLAVTGKEPALALDGGADGLDLIRELLPQARKCLKPNGLLLLEIDTSHAQSAPALVQQIFSAGRVEIIHDLAGHARILVLEI